MNADDVRAAEQRWHLLSLTEKDEWAEHFNDPRCAFIAATLAPPTVDEMEGHFIDANERMGEALVAIGMALGLPRPRVGVTWGAPEILARIADLHSADRVETAAQVLHDRRHRAGTAHTCDRCREDAAAVAAVLTASSDTGETP